MKERLRFKIIAVLIVIALTGLIAFQGYWLRGLYDTLYNQMEANIQESMRLADFKEMFLRLEEYKEREGLEEYRGQININDEIESEADTINSSNNTENFHIKGNDVDKAIEQLLSTINSFEEVILQGMHHQVDTLMPIRFHIYDSVLVSELKNRNIEARYQLNLVHEMDDKHTVFQTLSKNHPGMEKDTTAAALDWRKATYFDYPVAINAAYFDENISSNNTISDPRYYRLYLKNPERIVLMQMTGILISSFLVLIIIVITFVYLLRTILQQKTEEELKTDFTNNMTHELKTPISVSYAAVDSLLNYGDPVSEKQEKYLTIVKEQLTHLTGLVEQILTLSVENRSTFRLRPEPIRISEIVTNLIEQSKVKSGRDIQFEVEIPDRLEIIADRTHLYNMLSNLIDNAIKYANKKPIIIGIKAENHNQNICLSVTDNGPGINMAHQNRIFDKFYRIPSGNLHNVKGHGLGLYYVKDMMAKHDGNVTINSVIGKGSTFTLHFKT